MEICMLKIWQYEMQSKLLIIDIHERLLIFIRNTFTTIKVDI